MGQVSVDIVRPELALRTIFAAELFSKLSEAQQEAIIAQIECLLSEK